MKVFFFTLFVLSLLTIACQGIKPKQHHFHAKNPLKFFQALWTKLRNKSEAEPEVVCTINGAKSAVKDKRAELQALDNEKASLQKKIKKLNTDMEQLKVTTQIARRDLTNVLVEKTRGEKSIADAEQQQKVAKTQETNTTEEPSFPSYTVLTFTSVALMLCFVAEVSKLYESNIKITKLTQRLVSKAQSPSLVVEKEVVVYRNRIAELESQGLRERTAGRLA